MKSNKFLFDNSPISLAKLLNFIFCKSLFFFLILIVFTPYTNSQISSNSLHFDGSNFLIVGEDPLLDIQSGSSTTYEGWIRFCSDGMIFSKNWCNGDAGYYLQIVNGGQIRVLGVNNTVCNMGNLFQLTTNQAYAFNTWHHFAVVIVVNANSTDVKVYMNGALVLSTVQNGLLHNSSQNFIIGAYKNISGTYGLSYTGDIDEFRIYNTALLPSEMGLPIPTNPLLIIHYPMEPQVNPMATSEPNLGTLGATFNADDVALSSPSTPDVLNYVATSDYLPNVNLGADTILNCGVNSLILQANNTASSYSWQQSNPIGSNWLPIAGANMNSLNYSLGSNYDASVVVIGTIGFCTDSDTINISVGGTISSFLGNDSTICLGQSMILDASIVSGTYLWQDGSVASSYTAASPGLYWVEVTNNGCVSVDSVNISASSLPSFNLGNDTILCLGETFILDLTPVQGNYLWQNGSNLPTCTIQNGTFWLSISNSCGAVTDSLIVANYPPISFSLGNDTTLCNGQTLTFDVSSVLGTYLWFDGSTLPIYNVTNSGSYWVEITNNGCTAYDTVDVFFDAIPVVNIGNDTTLCNGESLIINSTSNLGVYLWQDGSSGTSFIINQDGIYWLTVTNTCQSITDSINVNYYPTIPVNLGNDTTICSGGSLTLTCNHPNSSVIWQDGSIDTTFYVSQSGIYSVQLLYNGCVTYDTVQVFMEFMSQLDLGPDLLICEGEQEIISIQNQTGSIQWNTGSSEDFIILNSGGTYSAVVTNSCGIQTDSIIVESEECFCGFYVPNAFTPNEDEFNSYFNPVFDCIISSYELKIYNRWGEVIFESTDPEYRWDGTFHGRIVQDGIYTYKIIYSSNYSIAEMIVGHLCIIR
jgi:gliding motility-associated-like protein